MVHPQKCLIITVIPPGDNEVGEIWLRDICSALSEYSLAMIIASHKPINLSNFPHSLLTLKLPELPPTRHIVKRLLAPITLELQIKNIIDEALVFVKEQAPDVCLMVPFGYSNIVFCAKIADKIQAPIVSLVWDPLDLQVQYGKFDLMRWGSYFIHNYFYSILKSSTYCLVMSDEMGEAYKMYTNPITIRSGISNEILMSAQPSSKTEYYEIGFAGSLYGTDSFQSLVEALNEEQWIINQRPVRLIVIGSSVLNVRMKAPKHGEIIWLGRHSQAETILTLSKCDVLYLPYPMDNKYTSTVRMSFPTKLSTYVAANVPILYHGPSNSTVVSFVEKYPIASVCSTKDSHLIIQILTELLLNDDLRSSLKHEQCRVFEEFFSMQQFKLKIVSTIEAATF